MDNRIKILEWLMENYKTTAPYEVIRDTIVDGGIAEETELTSLVALGVIRVERNVVWNRKAIEEIIRHHKNKREAEDDAT